LQKERFLEETSMFKRKAALSVLLLVALCSTVASAEKRPFIDWKSLSNPVLSYPGWSIKDSAMAYRDGTFYVFFSAFYPKEAGTISHVVEVSTRDFKHFSQPIMNFDGTEDGWEGMCSPDVQLLNGQYVMTFNSWGDKPGRPNELFYRTSPDLVHWSERHSLALNLTKGTRAIDAAFAVADDGYYLIWKEGTEGKMRPRLAFAPSLDGRFVYVGDGLPSLLWADGRDIGLEPPSFHENFEFIHTNGQWYLLTTDHGRGALKGPLGPYLYKLEPGSRWLKWTGGYRLEAPLETFNSVDRDNAAAIYDWRQFDGYYYMIYAGVTERKAFAKRGWNRLGLARSKDLIHWSAAGQTQ
jgi:hypothetical protein